MIKTMNIHVPIFPANRIFRYVADVHLIAITFSYKSKKNKKSKLRFIRLILIIGYIILK